MSIIKDTPRILRMFNALTGLQFITESLNCCIVLHIAFRTVCKSPILSRYLLSLLVGYSIALIHKTAYKI